MVKCNKPELKQAPQVEHSLPPANLWLESCHKLSHQMTQSWCYQTHLTNGPVISKQFLKEMFENITFEMKKIL